MCSFGYTDPLQPPGFLLPIPHRYLEQEATRSM